ncbi:MAG: hypothetical protein JWP59_3406 [Massilia sp.]|nr:hypothetical protein [Massilia sp.]
MFIRENDQSIALRYLACFDCQARRAAKQYNLYAERASLEPFTVEELADMDARCEIVGSTICGEIKGDWDWAVPVFSRENTTFADLEKAVKMHHWRPRYKRASQHVHSGHRPSDALLGASEAKEPIMLVGRSNSGFTDPLHMTAISLSQIAVTVLVERPNIDGVVYAKILATLSDTVGRLTVDCDGSCTTPGPD